MVKRILDATASDFEKMDRTALLESIRLAEGLSLIHISEPTRPY